VTDSIRFYRLTKRKAVKANKPLFEELEDENFSEINPPPRTAAPEGATGELLDKEIPL
jgi:hypothetical protein